MYTRIYEILLVLLAAQQGKVQQEASDRLIPFFREQLGDAFDQQQYEEVFKELAVIEPFMPDTSVLKAQRVIDYLDYQLLRLLYAFIEWFLQEYPKPNCHAYVLLIYCGKMLAHNSSFHITERSYPNLYVFMQSMEQSKVVEGRLNTVRNQLADIIRAEGGPQPLPLFEIIVQLSILHCGYSYLKDDDHSKYSLVIRFARKCLPYLSFQQVLRICQNIQTLVGSDQKLHMLLITHVNDSLDFTGRKELASRLFDLKNAQEGECPDLDYFIRAVVVSSHFSSDDVGKLYFSNAQPASKLPDNFEVFTLQQEKNYFSKNNGTLNVIPEEKGDYLCMSAACSDTITVDIVVGGKHEERTFSENEELNIDQTCLLFKPSRNEVCCYKINSSSLYVSNVNLHYRGNEILNNVSLAAKTGETIAVVGPSGCGKSTMLTMLSGILEYTAGDIFFDGRRVSTIDDFAQISTYIPQDDILFRELTVRESIEYSVKLKVKSNPIDKEDRVRSTIDVLGLQRTEFLKIGNEGEKGISGGQRKRVNIGTTIVADMKPILLFDEPTSGLDPATDLEIMQLLRELSRMGHIVFCVTHNLSNESIGYFDKIMVLGKSGTVQFLGKKQRLQFFFTIKSTQVLFQKMADSDHIDYSKRYSTSPEYNNLQKEIDESKKLYKERVKLEGNTGGSERNLPGARPNFFTFFSRELRRKSRDTQFLGMCLIQPVIIALFICWIFKGPLPNGIFSLMTATLWIGSISGVREINSEMAQLKREYLYGTSLMGYFQAKMLSTFTFSAFQVVLLGSIVMLLGGYQSDPFTIGYCSFTLVLLLLNLFGVTLGLFLSSSIKSTLAAVGILPVIFIPLIIMGGTLFRHHKVDGGLWQITKANPLRICYEASFFCSNTVLRPQLAKSSKHTNEEAVTQKKLWAEYQAKLHLYNTDIKTYQEKYTEFDINDIFSSEPEEGETPPPKTPVGVVDPLLLVSHTDLWLDGYSLLKVDRKNNVGLFSVTSPDYYNLFPIQAPKAFSDEVSVQGGLGMYRENEEGEMSIYRPVEYLLIPLVEILLLCIGMYTILRNKLSSKF